MPHADRSQVFVSYSHADEELFKEFMKMLRPLQVSGQLDIWADTRIAAGDRWLDEINAALVRARVAVLLVSPDFLASRFIEQNELPPLLQAAEAGGTRVVPVHLRPSLWEHTALQPFQAAHDAGRAIAGMSQTDREEIFKAIGEQLLELVPLAPRPAEAKTVQTPAALMTGAAQAAASGNAMTGGPSASGAVAGTLGAQGLSIAPGASLTDPALVGLAAASANAADPRRRPAPSFEMLFDCIYKPGDILQAMFGVQGDIPFATGGPYHGVRDGQPDMRGALADALKRASGPLVVCARAGIGKTREVAELAHDHLLDSWTVCLARGGSADAAMGALQGLPNEVAGRRLLVIVDNLQARCAADHPGTEPYLARLEACLSSLRQRLAANSLRTVLVSRSGTQQGEALGLDPALAEWRGYHLLALPEFSTEGLVQMLTGLDEMDGAAGTKLDPATAAALVQDSDGKPSTLVVNVRRARYLGQPLSKQNWRQTEGESWRQCIISAQARHTKLGFVFQALALLAAAKLPPRRTTLVALSARLGAGAQAGAAVDALVDFELAGLRDGVLTPRPNDLVQQGLQLTHSLELALE